MSSVYIYSLLSMGGLAALLAAGLGFASKRFHIKQDERIDKIENALPGANCGACGYAGCSSLAKAIVEGAVPPDTCPVASEEANQKIAKIMGAAGSKAGEKLVAQVLCRGGWKETQRLSEYRGVETCKAASMVNGGTKTCQYGCLGLGDCAEACPFDAIIINENGIPEVDYKKCTGCGQCVEVCPRNVITLARISRANHIRCSSHDPGKKVRKICEIGCIGCGLCARVCPVDAITMEDNLAVIDYDKCINCGLCAEKCPTNTIEFEGKRISEIEITDKCVGCTLCKKNCPVEAISGEVKERHEIDPEICVKCGICADVCNVDGAIRVEYEQG